MSGHTPGPWVFSVGNYGIDIDSTASTGIKGDPCGESVGSAYRREDARLIVAAPDLLAAAREVLRELHPSQRTYDALTAAIAKAEGR